MNASTPSGAEPTGLQIDALREVANIACGHAATALSKLVGDRKVLIQVPSVLVASVGELPGMIGGAESQAIAVRLAMHGQVTGQLVLLLSESDAHALCSLLLEGSSQEGVAAGGGSGSTRSRDALERSVLGEVANIVASACLSAISTLTGLKLLPSTPRIALGTVAALVADGLADCSNAEGVGLAVVLETQFQTSSAPVIGGRLLLLAERQGMLALLSALGV